MFLHADDLQDVDISVARLSVWFYVAPPCHVTPGVMGSCCAGGGGPGHAGLVDGVVGDGVTTAPLSVVQSNQKPVQLVCQAEVTLGVGWGALVSGIYLRPLMTEQNHLLTAGMRVSPLAVILVPVLCGTVAV